jgi:hypothetical protein
VARIGGQGREEGLEPPFVGRAEEFRQLTDQLHGSEREGRLRVVAISGQAGLGKSRLVWELEKYLDGLAADRIYYWHQGRSPSYGEGIAYWALGEMIRRRAGIAESEDAESTRDKLRTALETFVPDGEERRRLEPALGALLGIDNADWAQREQLFSAWRTFFERIAERGPTVLVFEDLQWADEGLLDFIEHLLDWSRDKPILIVTLARPELLERRPNFGLGRHAFVAIHLEPLTDGAMTELLRGLVPTMAEDDLGRIVARAEGVPLYAVETIRALIDGGHLVRHDAVYEAAGALPTLDIPPTLRALIASRLDALDAGDKSLLQDASVVGIVFSPAFVAAVSGRDTADVEARLRALMPNELVTLETDPRSPERGQYRFMQGLLREVAYGSLSKRDRRTRHLAAARYLEATGDDELAGVLATHYLEAYRAAPEGEEAAAIAAQARVALKAAGERASRLHSHIQAATYFEQAMAVTFDPAEKNDLRVRAAKSAHIGFQFDKSIPALREAIEWTRSNRGPDDALALQALLATWLMETSQIAEAFEVLETGLAAASKTDTPGRALAYGQLARGYLFRNDGANALDAIVEALDVAGRLHLHEGLNQLLITKSWALATTGQIRESNALLVGAVFFADQEDDLFARIRGRFNLSGQLGLDDPRAGLKVALEGIAICQEFGWNSASMAGNAIACAVMAGDLDEVFRLEALADVGATPLGAFVYANAACAASLRGDVDGARRRIEKVEEFVGKSSSDQDLGELFYTRAFVTFADGHFEHARELARQAVDTYSLGASTFESLLIAARSSLYLADLPALNAEVERLNQYSFGAEWAERGVRSMAAAAAALAGRGDEAAALYRAVIGEWREADVPLGLAMTLLERSMVLPMTDQEVARGRDEAREVLAGIGAEGLVDRLVARSADTAQPESAATVNQAQERAAQATR